MKLTLDTIGAIAPMPPKAEIIVFDDDLPGFGVRCGPARVNSLGPELFLTKWPCRTGEEDPFGAKSQNNEGHADAKPHGLRWHCPSRRRIPSPSK
jgi:hypothetical protein